MSFKINKIVFISFLKFDSWIFIYYLLTQLVQRVPTVHSVHEGYKKSKFDFGFFSLETLFQT